MINLNKTFLDLFYSTLRQICCILCACSFPKAKPKKHRIEHHEVMMKYEQNIRRFVCEKIIRSFLNKRREVMDTKLSQVYFICVMARKTTK